MRSLHNTVGSYRHRCDNLVNVLACMLTARAALLTSPLTYSFYAAPEIVCMSRVGGGEYNPLKSDIWSTGVVLYVEESRAEKCREESRVEM